MHFSVDCKLNFEGQKKNGRLIIKDNAFLGIIFGRTVVIYAEIDPIFDSAFLDGV